MRTGADASHRRFTGIGSLPHHNIDAALEHSFRMGIPFLPQIPIRNPWEYMIAQALEGLPGLQADPDGSVTLNADIWASRAAALGRSLAEAFARPAEDSTAFESFEPSAATSSLWQPFVWELEERGSQAAKIQIAGPMTAQWALRGKDGASLEGEEGLPSQIYRLLLARALAMTRRLRSIGIRPIIFLDEPGLYGLSLDNPRHVLGLQELRIMIQTLSKEGATVGLHCCSNTRWDAVLSLGLGILSIDTALSLGSLLGETGAGADTGRLAGFLGQGGRLSLGVIPTGRSSLLHSLRPADIYIKLVENLERALGKPTTGQLLERAIYTPACGLAFHSVADAELIQSMLIEFYEYAGSR